MGGGGGVWGLSLNEQEDKNKAGGGLRACKKTTEGGKATCSGNLQNFPTGNGHHNWPSGKSKHGLNQKKNEKNGKGGAKPPQGY